MRRQLSATFLALVLFAGGETLAANSKYSIPTSTIAGATATLNAELASQIGVAEIKTTVFALDEHEHVVRGVLMRDLMKKLGAVGSTVRVTALDGYNMSVPTEDFLKYDVVLATEIDGKQLSVRDKGPAWVIYPASQHPELKETLYQTRSVWQVKSIQFD